MSSANIEGEVPEMQIVIEDVDAKPNDTEEAPEDNVTAKELTDEPMFELSEEAAALKEELSKIVVHTPVIESQPKEIFDPVDFPSSYKDNLPKEKLVLRYADNFRRQFVHLYRDRKPLFLYPLNEFDVEKFVCTTIRPTQLSYKELYDWDGAAEFVSDYLQFETLDPTYELPTRMLSPATVLRRQKGTCFEYSTLLCSLLIASGYDAYVVNGYATRETCLADESREICHLVKKKIETRQEEKTREYKKYGVKPPRDLRSKFEMKMEKRAVDEQKVKEEERRKEEELKQLESEKPPADPLYGLRIHSWVLILSGKREVPETFFIEPLTGLSHSAKSGNYLGIEAVWNSTNYWVNMQDCSGGVQSMVYDLGDCTIWEYMFPGVDKPLLLIPEAEEDTLDIDDEEDKQEDVEKHLDMPPSWVEPLRLTLRDFELRCPQGKKSKMYKRARLDKFAPYLNKDGLISRLAIYDDRELMDLTMVKEYFYNRKDKLHTRVTNQRTAWITEYYHPGRPKCLKEHQYKASEPGPETERVMIFYHEARVDGLMKRIETPAEMTEHYVDRDDFLYYRHIQVGKRVKKFGPQDSGNSLNMRPIVKMVERFNGNKAREANKDIAEMIYMLTEEKIYVKHHTEDKRIASSTREFTKPAHWDEKGAILPWANDMHITFQVDPNAHPGKQVELYQSLLAHLRAEEECRDRFRESEEEVREILDDRVQEETDSELDISAYDTDRNEKAKKHRVELERMKMEEKMRKQDFEIDYLAPFLAQIGDPPKISRPQAYQLKEDCLADLKQRLIDKANLIQARFEKETQELQKKQAWYHQNQVSMLKDDEDEYLSYCSEAMFRIHILELRLNRHKEMAPHKYMALEQRLRSDSRMAEYF